MREVYEGICGNHLGFRPLVHKLVRAGYYWPTMQKDAEAYVRACDKCQRFSNIIRQPIEELTPMTAIRTMGVRYYRTIPYSSMTAEVPGGGH